MAAHIDVILKRTATALEQSAKLADEHAARHARAGREETAERERRAARRARAASQEARAHADRCAKLSGGQDLPR